MSKTYDQVVADLNAKIPREAVSLREGGGGKKLSYLEGHYVINRLNEVLGVGNWAYTADIQLVHSGESTDRFGKPKYVAHYIAKVRMAVTLPGGVETEFTDFGYGDGQDATSPGKPHELAVKESVTDGLKRVAKNLGMSMGLALYDKTQENVEDSYEISKQASAPRKGDESNIRVPAIPSKPEVHGLANGPTVGGNGRSAPGANVTHTEVTGSPTKADVLKSITSTSRVIIAKNLKSEDELRSYMKEKYGVESKESLPLPKAKELLTYLQGVVNV